MVIYHILFLKRTGIANLAWDFPVFEKRESPCLVLLIEEARGRGDESILSVLFPSIGSHEEDGARGALLNQVDERARGVEHVLISTSTR